MEKESNQSVIIAIIITFVIAFWIGFFVGWLITGRSVKPFLPAFENEENKAAIELSDMRGEASTEESSQEPISGTSSSLRAENQLAGRSAHVSFVTLAREGWVVIHEDTEGKPGAILGAAWLPAGSHEQVTVDLLRGMEAGRRYYAMLHREAEAGSESHLFDFTKDFPLQDATSKVIMVSFETIASPN